jgi:group II intron reverse transcriptase/maturase
MRTAETVLGVIQERGRRRLPLENLYRQLYNRDLFVQAYGRLYRNAGALTPGATPETVDGMSLDKIDALIEALRQERYRWTPVRRTYIPKKSGKLRPLGLPTWSDKLLQEGIRLLLEAYYELQFSPHSHGFRPGRGCHTALGEITKSWRGVKWFIEGDISQCFDSLNHEVMLSILRERIHDNRFLRLLSNLLQAGYVEDWRYNATLSGAPQGGVVSPLLSNIYLDRLDQFVETVLLPAYNRGDRRRPYPPYTALLKAARNKRMAGALAEAKRLRKQAQQMPSRDPNDPEFRRLWYVRYADDWLLGFSGPREEAEAIKAQLHEFLRETLKLKLSEEKTLITNARTQSARFLGYEVINQHADDKQCRAQHRRCINGVPGLKIPEEVLRARCATYMRRGKAFHLAARINDADYSIVTQYQAEYRGFVQYYLLASNAHRLWRVHHVMQLSLVFTLADKYRTSAGKIFRKYKTTVKTAHGTLQVLEARHTRGGGKEPLVARFGGIALRRHKQAILNDEPKQVYGNRSEVVQRLLAQRCELCGATANCEVHHVRKLADLSQPGRREKPLWVRRMASRRRKTLVLCRQCHEEVHRDRPSRHKVMA